MWEHLVLRCGLLFFRADALVNDVPLQVGDGGGEIAQPVSQKEEVVRVGPASKRGGDDKNHHQQRSHQCQRTENCALQVGDEANEERNRRQRQNESQ